MFLCLASRSSTPVQFVESSKSTQTGLSLTSDTPRKKKLRSRIKYFKATRKTPKLLLNNRKKTAISFEDFLEACDKYLSPNFAHLVKINAKLNKFKPLGRRYSTEYKQFALSLYFLSPNCYKFMSNLLNLPSVRRLQQTTESLSYLPGIQNDALYNCLKVKLQNMANVDRNCILCMDEMALKSSLFYHIGRDEIIGIKDYGDGKKEFDAAQNVTVIMARGLHNNWKEPLAYCFTTNSFPAAELKIKMEKCINKISKTGLIVRAVIADMGSNFIQLSNILGITLANVEFLMDNQKFIYLFDTPHLIKATRNNLLKNHFEFEGNITSWSHIKEFYEKDIQYSSRCAPKLCNPHIYPTSFEKMKVKYAVQVLSNTVASAMRTFIHTGNPPADASNTVEVIDRFNNIFDILNSSLSKSDTLYQQVFKGEPDQLHFLEQMCIFLRNLRIFNKMGVDVTRKIKFINGWLITINGIIKLGNFERS